MSYLSNLVAFLSVNTLTKSQNINPKHPIHDESAQHKHNIGLISYQPPTIDPQIPVGFKYGPPLDPTNNNHRHRQLIILYRGFFHQLSFREYQT
ncbi:hypothetical protein QL285_043509 [Trifolium repens]|nr:hypothetical protein QL285_043509 [Trifolium repens]